MRAYSSEQLKEIVDAIREHGMRGMLTVNFEAIARQAAQARTTLDALRQWLNDPPEAMFGTTNRCVLEELDRLEREP